MLLLLLFTLPLQEEDARNGKAQQNRGDLRWAPAIFGSVRESAGTLWERRESEEACNRGCLNDTMRRRRRRARRSDERKRHAQQRARQNGGPKTGQSWLQLLHRFYLKEVARLN